MFIVFVGPPGAGKGTQARRIGRWLDVPHLSTGDMLREARHEKTDLGARATQYIDAGRLVPDELILDMVKDRIEQEDCQSGCLLDGFPRNVQQAQKLDQMLADRATPLNVVVEIQVEDDELRTRILKRAEIEGRADDTPDTVSRRLDVYRSQTEPVLAHYRKVDKVEPVDGQGTPDEIFERIASAIKKRS